MVNTPEQRRTGIRDSRDLALADWTGSAQFGRAEDHWPREWAEAYVDFAATEIRPWLRAMGMRRFPIFGRANRGQRWSPASIPCRRSADSDFKDRRRPCHQWRPDLALHRRREEP